MDNSGSEYPVYIGIWVNWSHGRVLGTTLTLTRSDGALLIAFVAFFIAIIGTQAWRIICFILFHSYSNKSKRDVLHEQRQVILRNSTSPIGGLWSLVQVIHAWAKSTSSSSLKRLSPLLLITLIVAAAVTMASGFSSQITQGNEVLIRSPDCGFINKKSFNDNVTTLEEFMGPYIARRTEQASDYAQRCYESSSDGCGTFSRRSLPITAVHNASCPFDESLCISNDSNLILDTGLMDSLEDLGLNFQLQDRFQMQYRLHCAPLATDGFRSTYEFAGSEYTRYQYGQGDDSDCNCTVAIDTERLERQDLVAVAPFLTVLPEYSLASTYAIFSNGSVMEDFSHFNPIPELSSHGGDLTLVFLSAQSMRYSGRSQDDWYRATTPGERHISLAGPNPYDTFLDIFVPDEPAWPMGCVEQAQICKHNICTGLGPWQDTIRGIRETLDMSSSIFGDSSYLELVEFLTNILATLGKKSLASRFKSSNLLQSPPAVNEWHFDAMHWFATILASLQIQLAEIPSGPRIQDQALEDYITRPNASERHNICGSQKIRSANYSSFSVLGIGIILLTGVVIVTVSATIEPVNALVQRRLRPEASRYAQLEWRATRALHLQRLAHADEAEWVLGSWDIPITKSRATIGGLDEEDPEGLPRLLKPKKDIAADVDRSPYGLAESGIDDDTSVSTALHLPDTQLLVQSSPAGAALDLKEQRATMETVSEVSYSEGRCSEDELHHAGDDEL